MTPETHIFLNTRLFSVQYSNSRGILLSEFFYVSEAILNFLHSFWTPFKILTICQVFIGVAISKFLLCGRGRFRPNCGRMSAQMKLIVHSSSTPTAAAAKSCIFLKWILIIIWNFDQNFFNISPFWVVWQAHIALDKLRRWYQLRVTW